MLHESGSKSVSGITLALAPSARRTRKRYGGANRAGLHGSRWGIVARRSGNPVVPSEAVSKPDSGLLKNCKVMESKGESQLPKRSMWTPVTRSQHDREHLRYGSDLTDEEWALLEPLLPPTAATGRPRRWPMREVMNGLVLCPSRRLPLANVAGALQSSAHSPSPASCRHTPRFIATSPTLRANDNLTSDTPSGTYFGALCPWPLLSAEIRPSPAGRSHDEFGR